MMGMYLMASKGSVRSAGLASADQSSCQRLVFMVGRCGAASSAQAIPDAAITQPIVSTVRKTVRGRAGGFDGGSTWVIGCREQKPVEPTPNWDALREPGSHSTHLISMPHALRRRNRQGTAPVRYRGGPH